MFVRQRGHPIEISHRLETVVGADVEDPGGGRDDGPPDDPDAGPAPGVVAPTKKAATAAAVEIGSDSNTAAGLAYAYGL